MPVYYNKQSLYKEITKIKNYLGFDEKDFNIDLVKELGTKDIILEKLPYKTKGLRGMAVLGNDNSKDIIILNSSRNKIEQNYDCGHEYVHLSLHRSVGGNSFNCFDNIAERQNPIYEWHANEGAAEMFVPYKVLLPILYKYRKYLNDFDGITSLTKYLSGMFFVPEAVIKYRFENLKYEISQYLSGTRLNDLDILSLNQQKRRGICVKSLNDICYDDFVNTILANF